MVCSKAERLLNLILKPLKIRSSPDLILLVKKLLLSIPKFMTNKWVTSMMAKLPPRNPEAEPVDAVKKSNKWNNSVTLPPKLPDPFISVVMRRMNGLLS